MSEPKSNLVDNPLASMSYIVSRHIRTLSDRLRPFGLTTPMWRILYALHERDGRNIGEIAEHAAFERSYISRVIERMERSGWVLRSCTDVDKRYASIHLTEDGRDIFNRARSTVKDSHTEALSGLTEEEQQLLRGLLRRVQESVYRRR